MNSINMLDNMDAITGSVSVMILLGLVTVILVNGNVAGNLYLFMLIGVLGSLIGFLYFNWSPSKIYMGDTGSQFLGVFLASTSILYFWNFNDGNQGFFQIKPFVIPALFFIVPLIDTTTVTIRRLMRKQSPFVGGKDHITHHLAYMGLKDRQVAYTLIATTALSFPLAVLLLLDIITWNYVTSIAVFAYVLLLFSLFQVMYIKGARKQKLRQKEERAIPKITQETYSYTAEQLPVSS
jgi:UDP-GlcNAc:undecaprenyl-phosphate GlcNAc-1-phosphate transferase